MKEVRIGMIGCGNIGKYHMSYFPSVPNLRFTAAADTDPQALQMPAEKYKVATFDSGEKLIASGLVDAVVIGTPHYFHPPLASAAFARGLHVMSEKPLAVTTRAAATVIAAHQKHPKLMFGVMFQMRTIPVYRKAKEILDSGMLGELRRVNWIATTWFRTQAYYNSGGWRATWAGEGGGVLMNQCPHNLDMYQWLVGLPTKVSAHIGLGKYHDIEVEDDVTAYLEYANGATGVFITTTGEAPGTNRLEVVGDRGKMVLDGGPKIEVTQTSVPVGYFCRTCPESFPAIPTTKLTVEVDPPVDQGHKFVTEAFVKAILTGDKKALIAQGEEGIRGVELNNAMMLAGLTGKTVAVPVDGAAFERVLGKLAKTSKFRKKLVRAAAADMGASFQKAGK
jgi:predicted dehydrogenase